jgi:hypothetical protein
MKRLVSFLTLLALGSAVRAQEPLPGVPVQAPSVFVPGDPNACPPVLAGGDIGEAAPRPWSGNHNFPNFIDFISNPLQNIDPRAVTAMYPIFGSAWFSSVPAVPDGDLQLYGPALTLALSDRLAVGLNQGGYASAHLSRDQRSRIVNDPRFQSVRPDRRDRLSDIANGGNRDGWLNPGGFAQYTLLQDVPSQFLLTGGVRLEVPCGSHEVFQGYGPAEMATYLTAGKELGEFHVLATAGYQFPLGPGSDNEQYFYANVHLDRRLFGWLYPLVEFNCLYHNIHAGSNFELPTRRGFIDFNSFSSTGNGVFLAVGANAVLVREKLELGAVYTTNIASQNNFNENGLIVKMVLRY